MSTLGDTRCPYCDGTTDQHAATCGTLLPPIEGTIDVHDPGDWQFPPPSDEEPEG